MLRRSIAHLSRIYIWKLTQSPTCTPKAEVQIKGGHSLLVVRRGTGLSTALNSSALGTWV